MLHFVRNENIALYKKLIAESENDPSAMRSGTRCC